MNSRIIFFFTLIVGLFSCEDDHKVVDPIYEFVSFKGENSINLNENANSLKAYPLVVQLHAFEPYKEDIELSLEIAGNNTAEDIDFTVFPADVLKIPAGKLVSDTLYIKTIDNENGTTDARSFEIRIKSINKENINIGLGLAEPKNAGITINILDDECSEPISIFNSTALSNTLDWGGGDVIKQATGTVVDNTVKVTGDLIDYSAFSSAAVTITLTPEMEGSTKGSAIFGEQAAGTDNDGYEYKFIQVGEGSYDTCSGTIQVEYDIYYAEGAGWTYWYSVSNVFSVQ